MIGDEVSFSLKAYLLWHFSGRDSPKMERYIQLQAKAFWDPGLVVKDIVQDFTKHGSSGQVPHLTVCSR